MLKDIKHSKVQNSPASDAPLTGACKMSGCSHHHCLLSTVVRDKAPIEGHARLSWVHRSMIRRLSNVLRISMRLFSTFHWPCAEGVDIDFAMDIDPFHRA